MIAASRPRERPWTVRGVPPAIISAIAVAWILAALAEFTGRRRLLEHDALIDSGLPLWTALGLHLAAWLAMIVAMMLPTSLPLVRLFALVSRSQPDGAAVIGSFLGGYAFTWSAFGAIAFLGDQFVHLVVDSTPWLDRRPWIVAGGVLALAGAFQFSSLKDRCLKECRHPGGFLVRRYRRGPAAAFRLGREHGLYCVGCCWALMLIGFAVGVVNLWWMVVLTALMVFEKTGRGGQRGARPIGIGLIALGLLTLGGPASSIFATP